MLALFNAYPALRDNLTHIPICDLPTPVERLPVPGLADLDLWVKRDDISAPLFGGNKARTLEFLLAEARNHDRNVVFGLAGTSMALATNIYAHQIGIPVRTTLFSQTVTEQAQTNLRYFGYLGADLHDMLFSDSQPPDPADMPFVIDPAGPRGMCGYINAMFELKQQVDAGEIPEPDVLYVSTGLLGTSTGFLLGAKAAGLNTRIVAAMVFPADEARKASASVQMVEKFNAAVAFLREHDLSFPTLTLTENEIDLRTPTPETAESLYETGVSLKHGVENITLDLDWTAPALATIVSDAQSGALDGQRVLFWHTYNGQPYPEEIADFDYRNLPEDFYRYFEADELEIGNRPLGM